MKKETFIKAKEITRKIDTLELMIDRMSYCVDSKTDFKIESEFISNIAFKAISGAYNSELQGKLATLKKELELL